MKNFTLHRHLLGRTFRGICLASALGATSAFAAVTPGPTPAPSPVVFDLNPNNLNQAAGSTSVTYTGGGTQITASGFNLLAGGVTTTQELFFKSQPVNNNAIERGLGITGPGDNELQAAASNNGTLNFIQLDLTAVIQAGFINGAISVGSVQAGETFQLFGSNQQGVLGAQLGVFGSTFDDQFVAIPGFGTFNFISVAAGSGDVLPVAFQATPVPEMSALMPIVGLLAVVGGAELLRRRRTARLAA